MVFFAKSQRNNGIKMTLTEKGCHFFQYKSPNFPKTRELRPSFNLNHYEDSFAIVSRDKTFLIGNAYSCFYSFDLQGSRTTQMPDFLLPSCLIIPSFCNIDKSRSRVRFDIDKIVAICSTMIAGFSLINDRIRFCRLLISITWQ